jgi:hypothetical protein
LSDLHLALLGLAGVLLVALFAYNKWQERRMLRELGAALRGGVGDPLLQPAASAAGGTASSAVAASAGDGAWQPTQPLAVPTPTVEVTDLPLSALYGGRIEPHLGPIVAPDAGLEAALGKTSPSTASAAAPLAPAPVASPRWVEDPMLDWVLELRCAHAVDGVSVFDAAAPLARLESPLPVFLVAWDARTQQWVEPDRFGFYSELLAATQLAHRKHRIDEIGASRFIAAV